MWVRFPLVAPDFMMKRGILCLIIGMCFTLSTIAQNTVTNIVNVINITNITSITITHVTDNNQRFIVLPAPEMRVLQEHLFLTPNEIRTLQREAMLEQRQQFMLRRLYYNNR